MLYFKHGKAWRKTFFFYSGMENDVQIFEGCPGHRAMVPPSPENVTTMKCSECNYACANRDHHCFSYNRDLSLLPRLARLVRDRTFCDHLYCHRKRLKCRGKFLRDYFDGLTFATQCELYGGEKKLKNYIFFVVSNDNFEPFKNRRKHL